MNFFQKIKLNRLQKKVQKTHDLRERQGGKADAQNEIKAQYELAQFYDKHFFDKKLPHAEVYALDCYRAAASLGDAKAEYICGQRLLEQAKFWDARSRSPIYGNTIHKRYATGFYEEAFAYLRSAEAHGYALAKRLLGMIYINAWGVAKHMDEGYKLILDSIEMEKAWARANKIFEELKLNSPEFFAALQSHKRS
jgi:hypothetical protein